jgi:hypothetical protein
MRQLISKNSQALSNFNATINTLRLVK